MFNLNLYIGIYLTHGFEVWTCSILCIMWTKRSEASLFANVFLKDMHVAQKCNMPFVNIINFFKIYHKSTTYKYSSCNIVVPKHFLNKELWSVSHFVRRYNVCLTSHVSYIYILIWDVRRTSTCRQRLRSYVLRLTKW